MNETVYEHIEGGDTFTVTAAERWSVGMLRRLAEKFPDEVTITAENRDGSIVAHVPFDWMRIVPKKRVNLSEERRRQLADNLERARSANTVGRK